jgi:hypothetical protein
MEIYDFYGIAHAHRPKISEIVYSYLEMIVMMYWMFTSDAIQPYIQYVTHCLTKDAYQNLTIASVYLLPCECCIPISRGLHTYYEMISTGLITGGFAPRRRIPEPPDHPSVPPDPPLSITSEFLEKDALDLLNGIRNAFIIKAGGPYLSTPQWLDDDFRHVPDQPETTEGPVPEPE